MKSSYPILYWPSWLDGRPPNRPADCWPPTASSLLNGNRRRCEERSRKGRQSIARACVIRSASDADNLCTCRDSRQRGLICAHSVAVGLHFIHGPPRAAAPVPPTTTPQQPAGAGRAGDGDSQIAFERRIGRPASARGLFPCRQIGTNGAHALVAERFYRAGHGGVCSICKGRMRC